MNETDLFGDSLIHYEALHVISAVFFYAVWFLSGSILTEIAHVVLL